jgi:hypothetical protein
MITILSSQIFFYLTRLLQLFSILQAAVFTPPIFTPIFFSPPTPYQLSGKILVFKSSFRARNQLNLPKPYLRNDSSDSESRSSLSFVQEI